MNESKKKMDLKNVEIKEGMVCGPDGCSLADHFDWAKKSSKSKK